MSEYKLSEEIQAQLQKDTQSEKEPSEELVNTGALRFEGEVFAVSRKDIKLSEKYFDETGGVEGYTRHAIDINPARVNDVNFEYFVGKLYPDIDLRGQDNYFHYVGGIWNMGTKKQEREFFIRENGLLQKPYDPEVYLNFSDDEVEELISNTDLYPDELRVGPHNSRYKILDQSNHAVDIFEAGFKLFPEVFTGGSKEEKGVLRSSRVGGLLKRAYKEGGLDMVHQIRSFILTTIKNNNLLYLSDATGENIPGLYTARTFKVTPLGYESNRTSMEPFETGQKYHNSFIMLNEKSSAFANYLRNAKEFVSHGDEYKLKQLRENFRKLENKSGPTNNQVFPMIFSSKFPAFRWCLADLIYLPHEDYIEIVKTRSKEIVGVDTI